MKRFTQSTTIALLLALFAGKGLVFAQRGDLNGSRVVLTDNGTGTAQNFISLVTPASASLTTDFTLTLPTATGSAGQVLRIASTPAPTASSATLEWATAATDAWLLVGNTLTSAAWNGTSGNRLGTNSAHALVLATNNATAQDILFFTGVNGANQRMEIDGATGNVGIGSAAATANRRLTVEAGGAGQWAYYNGAANNYNYFNGRTLIGSNPLAAAPGDDPSTIFLNPPSVTLANTYSILSVMQDIPDYTQGSIEAIRSNIRLSNGAGFSGTVFGNNSRVHVAATNTGTFSSVMGYNADVRLFGGTITDMYGGLYRSGTENSGTTIGTSYGIALRVRSNASSTITNAYYLDIGPETTNGTVTNARGLYIRDIYGTNDYGVYQEAATDENYFNGNVGLGVDPSALSTHRLQVAGTAGTANVRLTSVSGAAIATAWTPGANDGILVADNNGDVLKRSVSAVLGSSSWALAGNSTTDAWNGTTGSRLGTTSTQALVIATTNSTAQDILVYTGASGASKRMEIDGTTGNVGIGNITPGTTLDVDGGFTIRPGAVTVNANNFSVTVGNESYIVLDPSGANRTGLVLADGAQTGQILILRIVSGAGNSITLPDNAATNNTNLTGNWVGNAEDTLMVIWTGTDWIEVSRSNN
jgi:hypothetical protein